MKKPIELFFFSLSAVTPPSPVNAYDDSSASSSVAPVLASTTTAGGATRNYGTVRVPMKRVPSTGKRRETSGEREKREEV
jgi:hypothetical protein